MNKILSSIKENKNIYIWSLVLVLLHFGIDFTFNYATDTYSTFNETGTWYHVIYENGRPLKALIYYVIEIMNIPAGIVYHASQASGMLMLAVAVAMFTLILKNYLANETLCLIISFVTLVNPFFIEFMLFEEKGLFMLVILLNIIALSFTEKRWRTGEGDLIKEIIIVQLCLWVSVFIYQTIIEVYVVLCLPFIAIWSKSVKDFISKNIYVMIMYGVPMGCAFLLAKFFLPVERLDNNLDLAGKIQNFIRIFKFVTVDEFYTLRKGLFLIWLFILFAVAVFAIIRSSQPWFKTFFYVAYISIGCTVVSFLLYITGSSTVCWPRMIYTYGMLFGCVLLYLLYIKDQMEQKSIFDSVFKIIAVSLLCIILVFDYISFGKVFLERHRANQEDMYYAEIIGQRIAEYEEETGITIDTLCYYKDYHIAVFGEGFDDSHLNERAQASGWSRHNSIEIYLDKHFNQGEPDPELQEMFSQKDWNMFSEEQLIFDGSTLHICVY